MAHKKQKPESEHPIWPQFSVEPERSYHRDTKVKGTLTDEHFSVAPKRSYHRDTKVKGTLTDEHFSVVPKRSYHRDTKVKGPLTDKHFSVPPIKNTKEKVKFNETLTVYYFKSSDPKALQADKYMPSEGEYTKSLMEQWSNPKSKAKESFGKFVQQRQSLKRKQFQSWQEEWRNAEEFLYLINLRDKWANTKDEKSFSELEASVTFIEWKKSKFGKDCWAVENEEFQELMDQSNENRVYQAPILEHHWNSETNWQQNVDTGERIYIGPRPHLDLLDDAAFEDWIKATLKNKPKKGILRHRDG